MRGEEKGVISQGVGSARCVWFHRISRCMHTFAGVHSRVDVFGGFNKLPECMGGLRRDELTAVINWYQERTRMSSISPMEMQPKSN